MPCAMTQRICKVTALRLAVNAWAAATASSCLAYTSLAAVTETESASPTVSGDSSSCLCEELAWIDARVNALTTVQLMRMLRRILAVSVSDVISLRVVNSTA